MSRRFPKADSDGTFRVVARYTLNADGNLIKDQELQDWIDQWVKDESPWRRRWDSGKIESLIFEQDFVASPIVEEVTGDEVRIRFHGREDSKSWKEWLVKFSNAIVGAQWGVIGLKSCENA